MGRYIIFLCPRCGMPRYAREGQKTAKCFYCGLQIRISSARIRVLARAEDSRTAREIVEKYKARKISHGKFL
ncbi:DUF1922 domain-containing protein [Candidatus Bathyarchaeota archaeon]|nr:MAG: DUF1922 domain-containing protein [Candidatus Bathyarchaeota archaeon]